MVSAHIKYLLRILKKLRILDLLNVRVAIKIEGHKFIVPICNDNGWSYLFDTEPWMINLLKELIFSMNEKAMFIDVGANIGQTLLKVKAISPQISYLGFEPNPSCIAYVYRLIDLNGLGNTELLPFGISDHTGLGTLQFYSQSDTDSSASIVANFREQKSAKNMYVPVIEPSNVPMFMKNKLGILKIDTEGSELEVLERFEDLIQRDLPFIICEILPAYKEGSERHRRQLAVQRLIRRLKYNMHRIQLNGELVPIQNFEIYNDLSQSNYLFVPPYISSSNELFNKIREA